MTKKLKSDECLSTHGGAGYVYGSYWDGNTIICGMCGYRIENPAPTGGVYLLYRFKENPWKWLRGDIKATIPTWPSWIPRGVDEI